MPILIRDTLLLVDESSGNREMLRRLFDDKFNILEAKNTEQAMFLAEQNHPVIAAVIASGELMTAENGKFLTAMKQKEQFSVIPVLVVIHVSDIKNEYLALEMGADDILSVPLYPDLVEKRVLNQIKLYSHKWNLTHLVEEQQEILHHSNEVMVDALISIIECRSVESSQHILRIRRFTQILLEVVAQNCPEYHLDERTICAITSAAALHDIGKISIPDAILNKPGRLTAEEFEIMKSHTTAGCSILERLGGMGNEDYLRYAYNICRYHHERWDGRGYPDGLCGDAIPICAQVAAVADVYDALTTERVYKAAYSCADAANMILNGECGAFSPKLLECFKLVLRDFAELSKTYADGYLPSSDAITVPLDPPERSSDNAVQYLLGKYEGLLHYLDAAVVEMDLDNDLYHFAYNPNPDLVLLRSATNISQAMAVLAENVVHPDDREMLTMQFTGYLNELFESGVRKRVRRYRIRSAKDEYRFYEVTTLRIATDDGSRKALAIWRPESQAAVGNDEIIRRVDHMFAASGAHGIPFHCRYDRWLTVEGDCGPLCELLGFTEEEFRTLSQNRLSERMEPDEYERLRERLKKQTSGGVHVEVQFPVLYRDGHVKWLLLKGFLSKGENGSDCIHGFLMDVSRSREGYETLRSVLGYHQLIFEMAGDILFEYDAGSRQINVSPACEERFGELDLTFEPESGMLCSASFHPDDIPLMRKAFHEMMEGKRFVEFIVRIANRSGRYTWNRIRAASKPDRDGTLAKIVGVILDVDKDQRRSNMLQENADRDTLTRLLNKEAARRQIEERMENSGGNLLSAIIILDLDNFKEVNDTRGHLFGDTLLMRVAEEIRSMFRGTDVMARIGGDEFLIFISNIPHRLLAEQRCQKLIDNVRGLYGGELEEIGFSCSAGISFMPDHGIAYQELFQCADRALYQAKREGKNGYTIYTPETSAYFDPASLRERPMDSAERTGLTNNGLAYYVFNRLYESGDVEGTIQSLLEIVGRQMNVSRVYIFENNSDNTECSNTFEWCNDGISASHDDLQNLSYETDIRGYRGNFNEYGIFYCPDVKKLPQHLQDILAPQKVSSLLQCAIRDNGQFCGFVGFDENTGVRMWTKEQIEMLTFLAQIISVFLLKKRTQEENERSLNEIRDILNNQYSWTYVVEPETFRLLFVNRRSQKIAPGAALGSFCHKVFMNRGTPCPDCPIMKETEKQSIIENPHIGLTVVSRASPIHWHSRNAWLVTCREYEKGRESAKPDDE